MLRSIREASANGDAVIDVAPTYVTEASYEAALRAAGAAADCVRSVLHGEAQNAFAIIRPPGHHSEPDRAMGFCLFNNVAIATAVALQTGLERVAIVDFDAHHGNGSQAAFLHDSRVGFLSTHQWGIYPGTGAYSDAPHARSRIVNVPLPAGAGDVGFGLVMEQIVAPFLRKFAPQLLLVSAGFDGHWRDPITSLGLSTAGFSLLSSRLTRLADEICSGRIVFVLEGGYDPLNIANGSLALLNALTNTPFADPHDGFPGTEPDVEAHVDLIRSLHGL